MKNLNTLIEKIKDIDNALDAYEYSGYTYEKYKDMISHKIRGDRSLRFLFKPGSIGKHIWTNVMQDGLDRAKKITNLLYLEHNNKYKLTKDDDYEILLLTKRLNEIREIFKKNTDNYSIYPIHSEMIGDRLTEIAKILDKYIHYKK